MYNIYFQCHSYALTSKAGNDKTARTKIHEIIRQLHPSLDSETFDDTDGIKKIKVSRICLNGKS